jgi:hypothetical protein
MIHMYVKNNKCVINYFIPTTKTEFLNIMETNNIEINGVHYAHCN